MHDSIACGSIDLSAAAWWQVVRALADAGHLAVWAGCGREHTLVALASGGVYSWGWGEGGRLGLGEVGAVLSPRRVEEVGVVVVVVIVSHIPRIGCQPEKNYFIRWPIPLVVC